MPEYIATHAAGRQFREDVATSLCGKYARDGLNVTTDFTEVTCWHCRQILKGRRAKEARRA